MLSWTVHHGCSPHRYPLQAHFTSRFRYASSLHPEYGRQSPKRRLVAALGHVKADAIHGDFFWVQHCNHLMLPRMTFYRAFEFLPDQTLAEHFGTAFYGQYAGAMTALTYHARGRDLLCILPQQDLTGWLPSGALPLLPSSNNRAFHFNTIYELNQV